jgi:hypothetical protein
MGAEVLGPILDLLGNVGINIYNQEQQKKKNELDYQRQMEAEKREYERNLEIWNMQNAYNHPQQQMTRLRQAGLNPNLVYGKGADNTAQSISPTKSKAPEFGTKDLIAPNLTGSINSAIATYNNTQQTKANIDQTHESIALMQKEQLLKEAEIANKGIKNARDQFELEQAQALKESVITKARLENESIESNTKIGQDRNEREKLMNEANLKNAAQDLINKKAEELNIRMKYATSQAEINKINAEIQNLQVVNENLKKEGLIKDFEAAMAKAGVPKSSPWWWTEWNMAMAGKPSAMLSQLMDPSGFTNALRMHQNLVKEGKIK